MHPVLHLAPFLTSVSRMPFSVFHSFVIVRRVPKSFARATITYSAALLLLNNYVNVCVCIHIHNTHIYNIEPNMYLYLFSLLQLTTFEVWVCVCVCTHGGQREREIPTGRNQGGMA